MSRNLMTSTVTYIEKNNFSSCKHPNINKMQKSFPLYLQFLKFFKFYKITTTEKHINC